ncbi:hypothetical protein QQ045_008784 [Rhodiola kirilowii]
MSTSRSSRPSNSRSTTTTPLAPAPPANSKIFLRHVWFERSRQLQQQASSDTSTTTAPAPPANLILLKAQCLQASRQLQQQAPSDTTATDAATDSTTKASPFDCNICLSQATEPVVTCCGHLYCWPCLYTWLRLTDSCAVCRGLLKPRLIFPIYGANGDDEGRDAGGLAGKSGIPPRPSGLRIDRAE